MQDIQEDQQLLARLVHQLQAPTPAEQFALLSAAQRHFLSGGPLRCRSTLPPLAFAALKAVRGAAAAGGAAADPPPDRWFRFLHQVSQERGPLA